jgi:hypothetical protein
MKTTGAVSLEVRDAGATSGMLEISDDILEMLSGGGPDRDLNDRETSVDITESFDKPNAPSKFYPPAPPPPGGGYLPEIYTFGGGVPPVQGREQKGDKLKNAKKWTDEAAPIEDTLSDR